MANPSAPVAVAPAVLSWEKFCEKWFTQALTTEVGQRLIRESDMGKSGLAGLCGKSYLAYRIALSQPPAIPGED